MRFITGRLAGMYFLLFALFAAFSAHAVQYPDKPVTIIVSNGPGGPVDITARLIAEELSKKWGEAVIVENRPGASGIISASALARSKPDGSTLGLVVASTLTVIPYATSNMPFDVENDLQPVSLVARTPFVFLVPTDSPIKDWADFISRAKEKDLALGSFSVGTAFHLTWEQIAKKEGIDVLYIPSPHAGKTQTDLLSGELDISLDAPSSAMGLIENESVRAIAVTGAERFASLPDVPTLMELGMDDYSSEPWIGLMAPKGLDEEIANYIHQSLVEVLSDERLQEHLLSIGMVPMGEDAQELKKSMAKDQAEMAPLVKELGISLN